ncbi:hypothetical protein BLNAU_3375 [Blattamonas nauphoetae]|uniref:Uncharacterized protein n=1 Tax=Blattamonas nauphoetae TaxID=2049346 RepID=A0ABQ9YCT6_9EUKA|nr:hypothetical protein BLNAU_3375 [Blattamonas nauphoetae]
MAALDTNTTSSLDDTCPDTSIFLDWDEDPRESQRKTAVVFRSLVATMKLQPALDGSLEEKAVIFLKYVTPKNRELADAFLLSLGRTDNDSSINFVSSIVVLLSSPGQVIPTAAMEMLASLFLFCSLKILLALVKADLIPQIITTLNPQSLSFSDAVDIHTNFINLITYSLWLSTPDCLDKLATEDENEQQAVHETVLKQVLAPSEEYVWHLCENRYSIVDGDQSQEFLFLLARLLRICSSYQPTLDFVLSLPVVLTIPSCLTFFENEETILSFLEDMVDTQQEWNKKRGEERQMGNKILRMLRMEGIEDVIEAKLQNDANIFGRWIVDKSIEWNNLQGMNVPERE